MKRILITGKNSYLGGCLQGYLEEGFPGRYEVTCISLRDDDWLSADFGAYDAVYNVAGIAHAYYDDSDERAARLYQSVNCRLALRAAQKAAADGAGQFIQLSSILVYGDHKEGRITADTPAAASDIYGGSKVDAERELLSMDKGAMKLCILRPPMIYGRGCRGNFPALTALARRLPLFPATKNRRSMLYVGNLCEFVRLLIENGSEGIFFPQNAEYSDTAEVIGMIAGALGKRHFTAGWLHWAVLLSMHFPGKAGQMARKAFGSRYYDMSMSEYDGGDYRVYSLAESIERTVL